MNTILLSLVLPAYNEENSIEEVVRDLSKALYATTALHEIIVVNNGSTDGTSTVLNKLQEKIAELRVVNVSENQGYGHGILQGFCESRGTVVGWCDADGQMSPDEILHVYRCLMESDAKFAKGCRHGRSDGLFRKIESHMFNCLFQILFEVDNRDINGKPKFIHRDLYTSIGLVSKDWFIDAECILKAHKLKEKILDVDIESIPRKGGKSKIRLQSIFEFSKNLLCYKMRGY